MIHICFYFQVHQPRRLRNYTFFDVGHSHFYEDEEKNRAILQKVAHKCYLPANALMLDLIKKYQGRFRIAYSVTGVVIEQFKRFSPETLDSFKRLADTGAVEFINETYYHSLSSLFSWGEFRDQVHQHRLLMEEEFGQSPRIFRNTELIYHNEIAKIAEEMGFDAILAEGADKVLDWRSPNFVYQPVGCDHIKLLLKNYQLSDDIAFRFSNRGWEEYPLVAEKFAHWVHRVKGNGQTVNLFMDYETFGEHQWEDTGIFNFLHALPEKIFADQEFCFSTPSEVISQVQPMATLDIPYHVSWADVERDLTAWRGNSLQEDALISVFSLEDKVRKCANPNLLQIWRSLQTSDHFYYMCTKWFADGDVHKYFNPYGSPYEAYINYQNVLSDFEETLDTDMEQKQQTRTQAKEELYEALSI